MTKYPLWPDLKMLIYATLPVAVTQPKYNYSVQICYTMLLMHWATTQISPTTVIVQNGYLLPHILVSYPLFCENTKNDSASSMINCNNLTILMLIINTN